MKNKILLFVIEQILNLLSPNLLKDLVDKILDFIEEKVEDTETEIDDKLVLPLVAMAREAFNIPDED